MDQAQYILECINEIDKKFDNKLNEILIQTTKTNGRVGRLEDWKSFIGKVLWAAVGIILTVIGFYFQNYISKH